jgi:hypothetical protein
MRRTVIALAVALGVLLVAWGFVLLSQTANHERLNTNTGDGDFEALPCNDAGVNPHATVGLAQINIDSKTHKLLPMDAIADYNIYPADNYDVLLGVITGPIGDHKSASFAFAGVWDYENVDPRKAKAPSRLEAILVVPGDPKKEGDLDWTKTIKLSSQRSTKHQEARVLGITRVDVVYEEKSDEFEIAVRARFAIGSHGVPYDEAFRLRVHGAVITNIPNLSKLIINAAGDDPFDLSNEADLIDKADLTALLQKGLKPGPSCSSPVLPARVEPPSEESVRAWPIHSAGLGKLPADGPLPSWLLKREGKTLKALLTEGVPSDQYEAMAQGYFDQDGYRIISPRSLDLRIRYSNKDRIMLLYPGKTLRTAEGTGLGSTLAELLGAHGSYTMSNWPEPYHCGVHVSGYKGVSFAFTSCKAACNGAKVQIIAVGGDDPWGEGPGDAKKSKEN